MNTMHPGELLREDVVPGLGIKIAPLARMLGVSRQHLHAILREEAPVSASLALKLGKLCGNGPTLWLNLQRDHDLQKLAVEMKDELDAIPTVRVA
jgi:addiction module HigA family antidote